MSSAAIFHATAMPDPEWWHASWAQPDDVVAAIGITAGMRVIELCCGDGWTLPLARIACHVFALDLDPQMLQRPRARLEAGGATNCELIEGDANDVARLVAEPIDCDPAGCSRLLIGTSFRAKT